MWSWPRSFVLHIVFLSVPASVVAQGAANLQIPPDVRAEGMGRVWAPLATTPYAAWSNVGGLGLLEGVQFAKMEAQLVPDLAPDVFFDYYSIVVGYRPVSAPVPLNFSIGFNRTDLDYGEFPLTEAGPEVIGTFHPFEKTNGFTFAVGVANLVGVGLGRKKTEVNLGLGTSGDATTTDYGILARSPYLVFDAESPDPFSFARSAVGPVSLRALGAVAWSNRGGVIFLVGQRDADPLPAVRRESIGFELHVLPVSRYVNFQNGILKRIFRDTQALTFSAAVGRDDSLLGDIPDSIVVNLSQNERKGIATYDGFEIRLFDIFSYRRGSIVDDPSSIVTRAYSLCR